MRTSISPRLLAAAVLVSCAVFVIQIPGHTQADFSRAWPGLWGPARTGLAHGLQLVGTIKERTLKAGTIKEETTKEETIKEMWRRPTMGGYSEVAVAGNQAITMELRGSDDFVVSVDAATGKERWSVRLGPTYRGHGGSHDGPIATPAIDGNDVFVAGPHGLLVALDASSGKERWRHDLVTEYNASVPRWGFGSSPLVEGQLIVMPTGGDKSRGLLAFDRKTGKVIWSALHAKAPTYSSAVAATIGGTRQIVSASGDLVFGVSAADGKLLWSVTGPGNDVEVSNSPIVLPEDRVLVTSWQGAFMLKLSRQGDSFAAKELWRSTFPRAANGPTIYRDGFLYGFAGPMLVCLHADTGEVRWRERTGEGTLAGSGEHLVFLSQTAGDLRIVRASPDGYTERTRTRVFAPDVVSVTGPSIADGRIFVRNIKEIAAFTVGQ